MGALHAPHPHQPPQCWSFPPFSWTLQQSRAQPPQGLSFNAGSVDHFKGINFKWHAQTKFKLARWISFFASYVFVISTCQLSDRQIVWRPGVSFRGTWSIWEFLSFLSLCRFGDLSTIIYQHLSSHRSKLWNLRAVLRLRVKHSSWSSEKNGKWCLCQPMVQCYVNPVGD